MQPALLSHLQRSATSARGHVCAVALRALQPHTASPQQASFSYTSTSSGRQGDDSSASGAHQGRGEQRPHRRTHAGLVAAVALFLGHRRIAHAEPSCSATASSREYSTTASGSAPPSQRPTSQAASYPSPSRQAPPTQSPSVGTSKPRVQFIEGKSFQAYTRTGVPVPFTAITDQLAKHDVVLLGETHDDAVAHALELRVWKAALQACEQATQPAAQAGTNTAGRASADGIGSTHSTGQQPQAQRRAVLSLEMFETDTQAVMSEYLAGYIRDQDLLMDGRAWPNYTLDYQPLVQLAREHGSRVICANAPRRLVSLVGRRGASALTELPQASRALLPPLPLAPPSLMYKQKIDQLMAMVRAPAPTNTNTPSTQSTGTTTQVKPAAAGTSIRTQQQHSQPMPATTAHGHTQAKQGAAGASTQQHTQLMSGVQQASSSASQSARQGSSSGGSISSSVAQGLGEASAVNANKGQGAQSVGSEGQQGSDKTCPYIGLSMSSNFYEAQNLWDATMAHNIARALHAHTSRPTHVQLSDSTELQSDTAETAQAGNTRPLVVHVCGKAHCEWGLGIVEHLARYAEGAQVLTVTFIPARSVRLSEAEFARERLVGIADYVVLTDGTPSFTSQHPV